MIETREVTVLMKSVGAAMKDYVALALSAILKRLDEFDKRLKALPAGPKGERGVPGEPGNQGDRGASGERGEKGVDGRDGRDGKDGRDGTPGRDALELGILPAIDAGKSYPRGTFAQHRDGLVRANRHGATADDLAGWDVIMEGTVRFDVVQDENLRTFTWTVEKTGGAKFEKSFTLPVILYRGIYSDGADYLQGDCVTYDNSMWICMIPTKAKPGISKDWQLSVRKGEIGRPGKDGAKGLDGKDGKDGRDWRPLGAGR